MTSFLRNVLGLDNSTSNSVVPPAINTNLNLARNNNARRRLNFGAQHPPGGEPEMVEEKITVTAAPEPMAMNVEAVEVMSPLGNEPTVGGRRRKTTKRSRKASRKSTKRSRKASRKASRKSRKTNRRN